ncbi:hypothetical protein [Marinobacter changyiensis]|uniref:hypothetical protein n=1 Tax=Marinobacter changyiensis TaxID=2604091 RepID=UPI001264B3EA|nr:hypothetical protein [Marinobacter changyiensis]
MISAVHQRKLLPTLVMLFALAGLSLSVIGESFSHGVAELAGDWESQLSGYPGSQDGHGHSHDFGEEPETSSLHHDAGNHTHETVDQLRVPLVSQNLTVLRQPVPFAGDSPRSLRYRLERPPKAALPA